MKDNYTIARPRAARSGSRRPDGAHSLPRHGRLPGAAPRGARLEAIRRISEGNAVDSQEHLTELLRREGFAVTQATLSRDLKRLGIGKAPTQQGGYTYILSEAEVKPGTDATYMQDFMRGFLSLEFSCASGSCARCPGTPTASPRRWTTYTSARCSAPSPGTIRCSSCPRNGVTPTRLCAGHAKHEFPGFQEENE